MTSVHQGGVGSWANRYPIPVVNASGEVAPAYAVMQIIAATAPGTTAIYTVGKPTGTATAKYVINTPEDIGADLYGAATDQYPVLAAIAGSPAVNQEIGPVAGSWALSVSGKGFIYLGGLSGGVGRVASKGGTTAGDDFPLVKIANVSGLDRACGSIVGYGLPVDPPPATLNRIPTFLSAAPKAGDPFAVLLNDIAYGNVGDAGPVGVVACQIDYTDATHTHADAANNNYDYLASAKSGPALIIWREKQGIAGGGTLGLQWARVRLDWTKGPQLQFAEVYSTIAAMTTWGTPGTGLVKFKKDDGTDDGTDPVEVENRYKFKYENGDTVLCDRAYSTPRVYADKGSAAVSGTFVCTLSGSISQGSTEAMGPGSGTVYSIDHAALTSLGTRTIFNPFKIVLPSAAAGNTIQYTCAKTYAHDPATETEANDEFTLTGIDPLHLLASLGGFGATKSLYTDGGAVTDIKWGGKQC